MRVYTVMPLQSVFNDFLYFMEVVEAHIFLRADSRRYFFEYLSNKNAMVDLYYKNANK